MTMKNTKVFLVLAFSILAGVARAQAIDTPGSIKIDGVLKEQDGTTVKNLSERKQGLRVLESFDVGKKHYAVDDRITKSDEVREVAAFLEAQKKLGLVGSIDRDCAECGPAKISWVLAEAMVFLPCQATERGQPKLPECTADEEKAEGDTLNRTARYLMAEKIRTATSLTFDKKQMEVLRNLFLAKYKNAPLIVAQVWPLIGPTPEIPEFGKN